MTDETDTAGSQPRPLILWFGLILAGWLLDFLIPLPFAPANIGPIATGCVFILVGFGIVGLALHEMRDFNAPDDFGDSIPTLVTGGVYRWSRNPTYLGLHLALAGAAIALDSLWILGGLIPFYLFLANRVIPSEERDLERIYGELYLDYKADVKRWF
jgi:protein-S-isoprenylcysteine O-methyltransferase Ste14